MNIIMDIDGVIADLVGAIIKLMNDDGVAISKSSITDWEVDQFLPEGAPSFSTYFGRPDIYRFVQRIDGAVDTVGIARELGHRVIFVTSAYKGTEGTKFNWLLNSGFSPSKDDYIECSDKSLIRGDIIIDDRPETIKNFPGAAIVFSQPWNAHIDFGPGVWRADTHSEVQLIIRYLTETGPVDEETHPIEIKYPNQTKQFRQVIEDMYRMHLNKNMDYSPSNIKSTGEIGLSVRILDKVLRALNLTGFELDVSFEGFRESKEPNFESMQDNIQDIAVYAVNWLIYRSGNWGK